MAYITPPASKTRIWDGYSGQETRDELMKRSKKMKAAGHGERLVQITRYPRFFPVSVYLVREDDGFTLINTGLKGSGREILEVAGRYGGQVRRIALTPPTPTTPARSTRCARRCASRCPRLRS